MKLVLTIFIMISACTIVLCQREAKAKINNQTADAYFRENKTAKEIALYGKKHIGKVLFPDQEIRCGKNCSLEILLCTGSKLTIKEADGWHRIPNIVCKQGFVPSFRNDFRPGGRPAGRQGVFRVNDLIEEILNSEEILKRLEIVAAQTDRIFGGEGVSNPDNTAVEKSVSRPTAAKVTSSKKREANIFSDSLRGNIESSRDRMQTERNIKENINRRYAALKFYETYYPRYNKSFSIPSYSNNWFFQYPHDGAVVVPELFIFDIAEKSSVTARRIHLFITLSAFENENSLIISREWKKEMYFHKGILTNAKGEPLNQKDARSFLDEVRKYYGDAPARIYCTVTVAEMTGENNVNSNLHTFGFEFHVMSAADEKTILEQLELSDKETGIARYLSRADIFENLGLIKLATDEYIEALKVFPGNEIIESRLRAINNLSRY